MADFHLELSYSLFLLMHLTRYPLEEFTRENAAEDKRCLEQVEDIIENQKKVGSLGFYYKQFTYCRQNAYFHARLVILVLD